jgi:hypothetical protein
MTARMLMGKELFQEKEKTICEQGKLKASAFLYSSGVHGLRITNAYGHIVVLPFQGQQIWDAVFCERRLTMRNFFDQPVSSTALLDSYGAFLYHCGALRMGTPGPLDTHPIHGELPAAPYEQAWLIAGEDDTGAYLVVSGTYAYTKAFGDKYRAIPTVKIYEERTVLEVSMTIENLAHAPMDLMYMCHINFLPAMNGEIVQATGWTREDMVIRSVIPAHVKPTPQFLAFLDSLSKTPEVTRVMKPEDVYNPEVVFYLRNMKSDAQGMTHMLQKHPDGSADYISWNVKDLDHTVRWILSHDDQKVMAMALPSTCDPEGYTAEKKKGNVRSIPGLGSAHFALSVGYLAKVEAQRIETRIRSL